MPRVEKLGGTNRLQVSSPVPIRSTGQARMEGEIIADFGDQMMRTTEAVDKIYRESKAVEQAAQADNIMEQGAVARQKATEAAATKFQEADGSDKLKIYQETFANEMRPYLDSVKDEEFKAQLSMNLGKVRNSGADTIFRDQMKTREGYIKGLRENAVGLRIASVNQNPMGAVEAIKKNKESLDAAKDVYRPDERLQIDAQESRIIANSAVQSLLNNSQFGGRRFEEARKLINGDLAQYLGEDAAKLNAQVDEKRYSWLDQQYKNETRGEDKFIKSEKERKEENAKSLFLEKTSVGATDEDFSVRVRDAYTQGEITKGDFEALNKVSYTIGAALPSNEGALARYNERVLTGDVTGASSDVIRDMNAGIINAEDGSRVLSNVSIVRSKINGKDPKFTRDYASGMEEIIGSLRDPKGQIPPSDSRTMTRLMADYGNRIQRGESPAQASRGARKDFYTDTKNSTYIESSVIPLGQQQKAETLKSYFPTFTQNINNLEKKGDFVKALEQLKLYNKRLQALEGLESLKEEEK